MTASLTGFERDRAADFFVELANALPQMLIGSQPVFGKLHAITLFTYSFRQRRLKRRAFTTCGAIRIKFSAEAPNLLSSGPCRGETLCLADASVYEDV